MSPTIAPRGWGEFPSGCIATSLPTLYLKVQICSTRPGHPVDQKWPVFFLTSADTDSYCPVASFRHRVGLGGHFGWGVTLCITASNVWCVLCWFARTVPWCGGWLKTIYGQQLRKRFIITFSNLMKLSLVCSNISTSHVVTRNNGAWSPLTTVFTLPWVE